MAFGLKAGIPFLQSSKSFLKRFVFMSACCGVTQALTHTLSYTLLSLSLSISLSLSFSLSLSPLLTLSDGKKAKLQNKMANHFLGRKAHKVVEANVKKYKN
jgi:hypothetical protein